MQSVVITAKLVKEEIREEYKYGGYERFLRQANRIDFDHGAGGQAGDGEGGSSRGLAGEELGVDRVHGGEVVHRAQEHRALDHSVHGAPGGLDDVLHVGERLTGLLGDASLHDPPVLHRQTATHIHESVCPDRLAVGTDGRRRQRTRDHLARHASAVEDLPSCLVPKKECGRSEMMMEYGARTAYHSLCCVSHSAGTKPAERAKSARFTPPSVVPTSPAS